MKYHNEYPKLRTRRNFNSEVSVRNVNRSEENVRDFFDFPKNIMRRINDERP